MIVFVLALKLAIVNKKQIIIIVVLEILCVEIE